MKIEFKLQNPIFISMRKIIFRKTYFSQSICLEIQKKTKEIEFNEKILNNF